MKRERGSRLLLQLLHRVAVAAGSLLLTAAFFLVLPLMQAIHASPDDDLVVQQIDSAHVPPPPPPLEEEPPPEEEPEEEPPPELVEDAPPLELSQLELALNPGYGGGTLGGDFTVKLENVLGGGKEMDDLLDPADLDQKPRVVYQPAPVLDASARKKVPGKVVVKFAVDTSGAVQSPVVEASTDPALERPALAAVKQWKFEPGRRNGQPVRFAMKVPITFPESLAR